MLKTMFLNEKRLKYSVKLLTYYLDISFEELLNNIHLTKNEFDKNKEKERNLRGDYVATINGSTINIEVNNNGTIDILERNMEYAHRLFSSKKRTNLKDNYNQVIQFNLNNFSFIGNDSIVDIYYIQNDDKIKLSEKLIFIQIYIPNLMRKWYTLGIQNLSESEKYLLALVVPDIEDSLKLGEGLEIMKDYIDDAINVSNDDDLLESYDKERAMLDLGEQKGFDAGYSKGETIGFEKGQEEGYTKGQEDGYTKGQEELIKQMSKHNISNEDISKITGLTIEKINNIVNN